MACVACILWGVEGTACIPVSGKGIGVSEEGVSVEDGNAPWGQDALLQMKPERYLQPVKYLQFVMRTLKEQPTWDPPILKVRQLQHQLQPLPMMMTTHHTCSV